MIDFTDELRGVAQWLSDYGLPTPAAVTARAADVIDEWQRVGDEIMKCATGKTGPLSDSDVIGVIEDLRAQLSQKSTELARLRDTFWSR